jgi:hypothetical protein
MKMASHLTPDLLGITGRKRTASANNRNDHKRERICLDYEEN